MIDIPRKYEKKALLQSDSIWGVLRGMESFAQMIYNTKEQGYIVGSFLPITQTTIFKSGVWWIVVTSSNYVV